MTPAKIYPFSIPAGGSFPLLVIGDYCKILSSSGPLTLTGDTFGSLGPILAGQGVGDMPFNRLMLSDNSGAINTGTILIADEKFIDDRVTGEVSVIDGEKARTLAGGMIAGSIYSGAPVVSQYPCTQVWNPAASGKNIVITAISTSFSVAQNFQAGGGNVAMATAATVGNKKIGAAAGVGQIRGENNLTALPLPYGGLWGGFSAANALVYWDIKGPIVIPQGFSFSIGGLVTNSSMNTNFEWFEEAA